jgi:CubicO group peptidase (beta-lactamase class C family)
VTHPTRSRRAPHHLPSRAAITLAAALTCSAALLAAGCAAAPRETIPPPSPTAAATSTAAAAPDAPPTLAQRFPDTAAAPPARDPQRAARLASAITAVDTKLRERVEAGDMVGLAAGVVVDGELTWSKGYGTRITGAAAPIDADTVFRAGSITKTLTGAALLRLRDDGKLTFDEPVARLVPELAGVIYPTRDSPPITVRHLVTHTAGLVRHGPLASIIKPGATPTDADLTGLLKDMKLEAPPGTRREYSNLGGALAGLVVTRAAKMPCRDYLSKTFLTPLGMTSSGWDIDPAAKDRTAAGHKKKDKDWVASKDPEILGAVEPAGGLYTTVRDLSRYAVFQMSAWPPRDEPETAPVRRSSLRESHQPAGLQPVGRDQKGVFWSLEAHCKMGHLVLHNGGMAEGFRSLGVALDSQAAVVEKRVVRGAETHAVSPRMLAPFALKGDVMNIHIPPPPTPGHAAGVAVPQPHRPFDRSRQRPAAPHDAPLGPEIAHARPTAERRRGARPELQRASPCVDLGPRARLALVQHDGVARVGRVGIRILPFERVASHRRQGLGVGERRLARSPRATTAPWPCTGCSWSPCPRRTRRRRR